MFVATKYGVNCLNMSAVSIKLEIIYVICRHIIQFHVICSLFIYTVFMYVYTVRNSFNLMIEYFSICNWCVYVYFILWLPR